MKVLHVISSGGMYGAESVILNLSRGLNESGHHSALGVFENSSNPNLQLHEMAAKEGIGSHLISCNGQIDRTVIASLRELVTRTEADVVHAHGYKADVYVYLALRGMETPFISTCHNWPKGGRLVALYGVLDRLVLRRFARVVAVSDEVKQRLLRAGVSAEKIRQIRNGIDLRPFAGAVATSTGGLTVGWVGRLSREKGADVFLRSAARVVMEVPEARFVVVGDGPDRETLEALIGELHIRENVSMLGRRDDIPSVLASVDVMVSSSRQEGLPMAILEGMASGLPLIATAVGDVPTVVRNEQTGVLVPAEDVGALSGAMVGLLRDPERRKRLGTAARRLIEDEFSAERMTAEYVRVYEEAMDARGKSQ